MMKKAKWLGAALIAAAALAMGACTTTMAEPEGDASTPAAVADIQGEWTLVSWSDPAALPDMPITLLVEDARVSGKSACNNYSGPLEATDSTFSVGLLATTMMLCSDDLNTAETTYQALLTAVNGWQLNDGALSLTTDGIEHLRFTATN